MINLAFNVFLKRVAKKLFVSRTVLSGVHRCYICKKEVDRFIPFHGGLMAVPIFVRELDLIGSDVDNFNCPHCRCHDRERHLWMYFDKLKLWELLRGKVLHLAPEHNIGRAISDLCPIEYIRGDLFPAKSDVQHIDATAISFPDDHFDFVICNHVLEHIPDDLKAMRELHRVLKPGGLAVLQTPFSALLRHTFEDPAICSDDLRLRFYGQNDHVRVYGHDFFDRLKDVGFELDIQRHEDVLKDFDCRVHGVNGRESLILMRKFSNTG